MNCDLATTAAFSAFVRSRFRFMRFRRRHQRRDRIAHPLPFPEQRLDDHGPDDHHDLFRIRIMGAELRALAGIEAALEQRAEDRRIDLRPVAVGGFERRANILARQGQRCIVLEQSTVEPGHRLEIDEAAAPGHGSEQRLGVANEIAGIGQARLQHALEHLLRQQIDVLREQAEHHAVDEVGDLVRVLAPVAQVLRDAHEALGHLLGGGIGRAFRLQLVDALLGEGPFELLSQARIQQLIER